MGRGQPRRLNRYRGRGDSIGHRVCGDWIGSRPRGGGRQLLEHAIRTFGATLLDVNEENGQAVGFYLHTGFQVIGRSDLDSTGRPHPILHLSLAQPS